MIMIFLMQFPDILSLLTHDNVYRNIDRSRYPLQSITFSTVIYFRSILLASLILHRKF